MDKEKLIERLMATFLEELEEHKRSLDANLLALEKGPPPEQRAELLKTVFRTVHSLKGAARSVSVAPVEAVCHRMEGIFADARERDLVLDPELFSLLFQAVDAIGNAGRQLKEKRALDERPLIALLPRLEDARKAAADSPPVRTPPPERAPEREKREAPTPEIADGKVRVSASKLDALLAASSQLSIARRRLWDRTREIDGILQLVARWKEEWRTVDRPLRRALSEGLKNGARGALSTKHQRAVAQVFENIDRLAHGLDSLASGLLSDLRNLEGAAQPLEEEVRRIRMLPFEQACDGLERAARDIAKSSGKEVELEVVGADIELDRSILEALRDPLLHLVRNAVAHGIETTSVREAAKKPVRGRIRIEAALRGDRVSIVVSDDGRGLDLDAIRETAVRRRLPPPADLREAEKLIFIPGFSTAPMITEVAGRGVGLDVVKARVEAIRGTVRCEAGERGLAVTLEVPLTRTTVRAVLLSSGGQIYALPHDHVRALVRAGSEDVGSIEGREVLLFGERPVPLIPLAEILGVHAADGALAGNKIPIIVLASGEAEVALAVDELIAEQEVVVSSLGRRVARVRHFGGATLLPNGRVALLLHASDLVQSAIRRTGGGRVAERLESISDRIEKRRLLVVDDSVTTRTLMKSILESAGYAVLTAVDGADAWRQLQDRGADLVVSDVEMPRMDGFGLTAMIKKSPRFNRIPVVLVTALESEEDKRRGLDAGADAYLVKSAFDQTSLLEAIAQLL